MMIRLIKRLTLLIFLLLIVSNVPNPVIGNNEITYSIVDTNQTTFYDNQDVITAPLKGSEFYGQDATYEGLQAKYEDNGDGTVTDLNTGLMWEQSVRTKMSLDAALDGVAQFSLGEYSDWRLPSIKELYSLVQFSGVDPSGWEGSDKTLLTPFIDTEFFPFEYGNLDEGERIIDAQYASSSKYVGTTMGGHETVFGVNFADGRIKGYGITDPQGNGAKTFFIKYVRGNINYGVNQFVDNGDGTISDLATGLMWQKDDSLTALSWEDSLTNAEEMELAGYDDWRLPNTKELQSILDYTRSPSTDNEPAIDPVFETSTIVNEGGETDYPSYWSSTTHANMQNGGNAVYISFGESLGWMQPPGGGDYVLMDVHGAGAQRSDPKVGDPADYPYGHGPQGDVVRIFNFARAVRLQSSVSTNSLETTNDKSSYSGFTILGLIIIVINRKIKANSKFEKLGVRRSF